MMVNIQQFGGVVNYRLIIENGGKKENEKK